MCGINGFSFKDPDLIDKMNQKIHHRGPDDAGNFTDNHISLGNVRLSIVDLSPKGHMPMYDQTKRYVITYNGEIYNYKELKTLLIKKGYKFHSQTDTEVIINLYAEYGNKCFAKLNGMFAIAIYDRYTHALILARDRVGIKPLYYAIHNNQLIFSSEIKALFCHSLPKIIDPIALETYLRLLYVPAPKTIYQNIYKLEPGQLLIFQNKTHSLQYYWRLKEICKTYPKDKQQAMADIRRTIKHAVRKQFIQSDRSVGIFLSGGIDSNIITHEASQISRQPLKTFSIRFHNVDEVEKFNADADLARLSSQFYGTEHHEIDITPPASLDIFQSIAKSMDEPLAEATAIPTLALAIGSVKNITVALSGDGGDETFYGYDRYLAALYFDIYQKIPAPLRHTLTDPLLSQMKSNKNPYFQTHLQAKSNAQKYLVFMGQNEDVLQKIHPSSRESTLSYLDSLRSFNSDIAFHHLLPKLDFLHWQSEESLMRADKMTMMASLEQRVPLLDNQLIDLADSLPFSWKVGIKLRKKILRKAYDKKLPSFIINAEKRGFFSPIAKWIRHPQWQKYAKSVILANDLKIYNQKNLKTIWQQHIDKKGYHIQHLYAALTLNAWADATGAHL